MKGGISHINSGSFISFAHVSTTGQRPLSPESLHHLIHQGEYR